MCDVMSTAVGTDALRCRLLLGVGQSTLCWVLPIHTMSRSGTIGSQSLQPSASIVRGVGRRRSARLPCFQNSLMLGCAGISHEPQRGCAHGYSSLLRMTQTYVHRFT